MSIKKILNPSVVQLRKSWWLTDWGMFCTAEYNKSYVYPIAIYEKPRLSDQYGRLGYIPGILWVQS